MLAADQEPLARRFADRGRDLLTQFDGVATRRRRLRVPPLDGCLVWLDCRTYAQHDGGDHTIVVGEVRHAGGRGTRLMSAAGEREAPPSRTIGGLIRRT